MARVHVAQPDTHEHVAICGATDGEHVDLALALAENDEGFDCVDCHRVLSGGHGHSRGGTADE